MPSLKIACRGIKVSALLNPATLASANLVPPEPAPAGQPVIILELEGGSLSVHATLNGKSLRRGLKLISEHGPDGVLALLQGVLVPMPGGGYALDSAGLAVTPKIKPEEPKP